MPVLDLPFIRAQFPALASNFVYLDNAGGSQCLGRVADRIRDYLVTTPVQLGASYAVSQVAGEKVLAARRAVAGLINAAHDEEVVMGGATTLLMFQVTQAIRAGVRPGDEIIVTDTDHEANIGAWGRLAEAGAVIRFWRMRPETMRLELGDLQALLNDRTRWVAMTQASNVLGAVNPVAEVAALVHAAGARLCVDAVAYAPHRLVDVQASGADLYVFSFYKVFGPHYAVLWGPRELLLSLASLNHDFIPPNTLPYKLQPGNVNYELSWGCAGIADYLVEVGESLGVAGGGRACMQAAFHAFERHEDALAERLLGFLASKPGVKLVGPASTRGGQRVPTISFVAVGRHSETIVRQVDPHRIGIRFGDFYARRLIDNLGLRERGGVVRVSIAHYNTAEEIDRLIAVLEPLL